MTGHSDDLDAAKDYREQQQARHKGKRDEFVHATSAGAEVVTAHLRSFLPGDHDIPRLLAQAAGGSPTLSEFDEPLTHGLVQRLCDDIEKAANKLGWPLHGGVSASSIMSSGLEAMQQKVMMTDASVVLVTPSLLLLCNRVGKLMARSLKLTSSEESISLSFEPQDFLNQCGLDTLLWEDWMTLFYDCAHDPLDPPAGKIYGLSGERYYLWSMFCRAMELFAVGHEYGHHIAKHSLNGAASSAGEDSTLQHEKECEADMIGTVLSAHAGADSKVPNVFAMSGAGAIALLTVLEYGRRAHGILQTGIEVESTRDSHPLLEARVAVVRDAVFHCTDGEERELFLSAATWTSELLETVWDRTKIALKMAHKDGLRPKENPSDWLPG